MSVTHGDVERNVVAVEGAPGKPVEVFGSIGQAGDRLQQKQTPADIERQAGEGGESVQRRVKPGGYEAEGIHEEDV